MLPSTWDLPGSGFTPLSPALAGGFFFFLTTEPPGKPFNLTPKIFDQEPSEIPAWGGLVAASLLETLQAAGEPCPALPATHPGRLPGCLCVLGPVVLCSAWSTVCPPSLGCSGQPACATLGHPACAGSSGLHTASAWRPAPACQTASQAAATRLRALRTFPHCPHPHLPWCFGFWIC